MGAPWRRVGRQGGQRRRLGGRPKHGEPGPRSMYGLCPPSSAPAHPGPCPLPSTHPRAPLPRG
eukprot:scaffold13396_cov95-Isochrysis_galbana.AAC.2